MGRTTDATGIWHSEDVQEFVQEIPVKLAPDSADGKGRVRRPEFGVWAPFNQLGPRILLFDPGPLPNDHRFGWRSWMYEMIVEASGWFRRW